MKLKFKLILWMAACFVSSAPLAQAGEPKLDTDFTAIQAHDAYMNYWQNNLDPTEVLARHQENVGVNVNFDGVNLKKQRDAVRAARDLAGYLGGVSKYQIHEVTLEDFGKFKRVITQGSYVGVRGQNVQFLEWQDYQGPIRRIAVYTLDSTKKIPKERAEALLTQVVALSKGRSPAAVDETEGEVSPCTLGNCLETDKPKVSEEILAAAKVQAGEAESTPKGVGSCEEVKEPYRDYNAKLGANAKGVTDGLTSEILTYGGTCLKGVVTEILKSGWDLIKFVGMIAKFVLWDIPVHGVAENAHKLFEPEFYKSAANTIWGAMKSGWKKVSDGASFFATHGAAATLQAGIENVKDQASSLGMMASRLGDMFTNALGKEAATLECLNSAGKVKYFCDWLGYAVGWFIPPAALLKALKGGYLAAKLAVAAGRAEKMLKGMTTATKATQTVRVAEKLGAASLWLSEKASKSKGLQPLTSAQAAALPMDSVNWLKKATGEFEIGSLASDASAGRTEVLTLVRVTHPTGETSIYRVADSKRFEEFNKGVLKNLESSTQRKEASARADQSARSEWDFAKGDYVEDEMQYLNRVEKGLPKSLLSALSPKAKSQRRAVASAIEADADNAEFFGKAMKLVHNNDLSNSSRKQILEEAYQAILRSQALEAPARAEALARALENIRNVELAANQAKWAKQGVGTLRGPAPDKAWDVHASGMSFHVDRGPNGSRRIYVSEPDVTGGSRVYQVLDEKKFLKANPEFERALLEQDKIIGGTRVSDWAGQLKGNLAYGSRTETFAEYLSRFEKSTGVELDQGGRKLLQNYFDQDLVSREVTQQIANTLGSTTNLSKADRTRLFDEYFQAMKKVMVVEDSTARGKALRDLVPQIERRLAEADQMALQVRLESQGLKKLSGEAREKLISQDQIAEATARKSGQAPNSNRGWFVDPETGRKFRLVGLKRTTDGKILERGKLVEQVQEDFLVGEKLKFTDYYEVGDSAISDRIRTAITSKLHLQSQKLGAIENPWHLSNGHFAENSSQYVNRVLRAAGGQPVSEKMATRIGANLEKDPELARGFADVMEAISKKPISERSRMQFLAQFQGAVKKSTTVEDFLTPFRSELGQVAASHGFQFKPLPELAKAIEAGDDSTVRTFTRFFEVVRKQKPLKGSKNPESYESKLRAWLSDVRDRSTKLSAKDKSAVDDSLKDLTACGVLPLGLALQELNFGPLELSVRCSLPLGR